MRTSSILFLFFFIFSSFVRGQQCPQTASTLLNSLVFSSAFPPLNCSNFPEGTLINVTHNNETFIYIIDECDKGLVLASSFIGSGLPNGTRINGTILFTNSGSACCYSNGSRVAFENCLGCDLEVTGLVDQTICVGETISLFGGHTGGGYPVNCGWSPNSGPFTATTPGLFTYTYTCADANGCTASQSMVIEVEDCCNLEIDELSDTTLCIGEELELIEEYSGGEGMVSCEWNPSFTNPVSFNNPDTYTYTLTCTDENGCTASQSINIEVKEDKVPSTTNAERPGNQPGQSPDNTICAADAVNASLREQFPGIGTAEDFEKLLSSVVREDKRGAIDIIPVIFHIIHDGKDIGSEENLNAELINAQLQQLNYDFRGNYGGNDNCNPSNGADNVDIEVEFRAAKVDPDGCTLLEPGINRINRNHMGWNPPAYSKSYMLDIVQPQSHWNPDKYLNIWIASLDPTNPNGLTLYGYAPSPTGILPDALDPSIAARDGIVLNYISVGSCSKPNPHNPKESFKYGRALVHEAGHWLGLGHLWGDEENDIDCMEDDGCMDTPNSNGPSDGCPTDFVCSCSSKDQYQNFMDYSDDKCRSKFTVCQKERIKDVITGIFPRRSFPDLSALTIPDPCADITHLNIYESYLGATNDGLGTCSVLEYSGSNIPPYLIYFAKEKVHSFDFPGGPVSIKMSALNKDLDLILTNSCDPDSVLAWSIYSDLQDEQIDIDLPAGTYYLFVDGLFSENEGLYTISFEGPVWHADNDGDGYGNNAVKQNAFIQPEGFVSDNTDCDDGNPNINPEADEICNDVDDNCDGQIDEVNGNTPVWYADNDQDGFGDPNDTIKNCDQPNGYVANNEDCDDSNPDINPEAIEVCNEVDDNCNGNIDEEDAAPQIWYKDQDMDGFGNTNDFVYACNQPIGYVDNDLDCNDSVAEINPLAIEACNGFDDNCNGQIDEGPDAPQTWYADLDMDGYGDPNVSQMACDQPFSYVLNNLDCDDSDANINPLASEICNGIDDDCDGEVDEGIGTFIIWYGDADMDGYGNPNNTIEACSPPPGFVSNGNDCNDADPNINPGMSEICNGLDDNCNLEIDEGIPLTTYYLDADGDGFGNPYFMINSCYQPSNYVFNSLDCDDSDSDINPDGIEVCNGKDDDCDGKIDEIITAISVSNISTCNNNGTSGDNTDDYFTADITVTYDNKPVVGDLMISGDGSAAKSVGQLDGPTSHTFENVTMTADGSFINLTATFSLHSSCSFTQTNAGPAPWACSLCQLDLIAINETDESCYATGNGMIEFDAVSLNGPLSYSINGGSGYQPSPVFNNLTPGNYDLKVQVTGDLSCFVVATATIEEAPANTLKTWYKDLDNDGYSDGITQVSCVQPAGYKVLADLLGTEIDCDDNKANWFPGQVWYPDYDVDFYGGLPAVVQCSRPPGHRRADNLIELDTDCNNNNPAINPGATEICNGLDDDCDGEIDEGTSGGLTWVGNVALNSQSAVNAWLSCYEIIDGNLTISGSNIDSLSQLLGLREVSGNVDIQATSLENMNGLDSLRNIGGSLTIYLNNSLTTLQGLDSLATVNGSLSLYYNFLLSDCCPFYDLISEGGITGGEVIFFNTMSCNSVFAINSACAGGSNLVDQNTNSAASISLFSHVDKTKLTTTGELQPLLRVFPNPTSGAFNIMVGNISGSGTLQLLDISHKVRWENKVSGTESTIISANTGELRPGLYFLVWKDARSVVTQKLIVK